MNRYFSLAAHIFTFIIFVQMGVTQPIDGSTSTPAANLVPGDSSRKSIANLNVNFRSSAGEKIETTSHFLRNKDPGFHDRAHNLIIETLRSRRSLKTGPKFPYHQHQPSVDMQTIMSGNWVGMDPESLFKLLNTLATSKETLPDDFFAYDEQEEDPIDLVYSGKKPLHASTSSFIRDGHDRGDSSRFGGVVVVPPQAEPISLMSSNVNNAYKDVLPLQMHRLTKTKKYFPYKASVFKKRSNNGNIWPLNAATTEKDLVQLPNGEIAFTPHGIHVLRYHQPIPLDTDEQLPLVRRPIL